MSRARTSNCCGKIDIKYEVPKGYWEIFLERLRLYRNEFGANPVSQLSWLSLLSRAALIAIASSLLGLGEAVNLFKNLSLRICLDKIEYPAASVPDFLGSCTSPAL